MTPIPLPESAFSLVSLRQELGKEESLEDPDDLPEPEELATQSRQGEADGLTQRRKAAKGNEP
jgi:hypothetical protein